MAEESQYYWLHNNQLGLASKNGETLSPLKEGVEVTVHAELIPQMVSPIGPLEQMKIPLPERFYEVLLDGILYRLWRHVPDPQLDPLYLAAMYKAGVKNYKKYLNRSKHMTSQITPYEY
jgi:hypothetical protein